MDKRILDIVSAQYISKKLELEISLEKLVNNPPSDLPTKSIVEEIMKTVSQLRNVLSDIQMWEGVTTQLSNKPEEGNNN